MNYTLAIEMGGVYTSIYRKDEGLVLKEPTLVCARKTGESYEIIAFGNEAKKLQGKTDDKTYIFSPMGDGDIKAPEYAIHLLNYFLGKVKTKIFKENAIFCINSTLNEKQKQEYLDVFSACKLNKIALVPNIICSAAMSGKDIGLSKTILALNMGGTLTEVACINMNEIIKGGSLELGGRHLDINIANMVADKYQTIISIATAQKIKEEIGTLHENDTQSFEVIGADETTGKPKRALISSADLRPVLLSFVDQVALCVETSINICPPEISADIVENGIFISGGVSNLVGLDKYLRKSLDINVNIVEENENAVILGAGGLLSDKQKLAKIINNF